MEFAVLDLPQLEIIRQECDCLVLAGPARFSVRRPQERVEQVGAVQLQALRNLGSVAGPVLLAERVVTADIDGQVERGARKLDGGQILSFDLGLKTGSGQFDTGEQDGNDRKVVGRYQPPSFGHRKCVGASSTAEIDGPSWRMITQALEQLRRRLAAVPWHAPNEISPFEM